MDPKIAIIGAGIAGLSTALTLYQQGLDNIVIFEAASRIGGRIKSIQHGGGWVELGAQWIHGQEGNVLHEYASSRGLVANPKLDYGLEGTGTYCTEQGRPVTSPLVEELISHLDEEKNMMHEAYESGQNVFEYFKEKFDEFISSKPDLDEEMINLLKSVFRWFVIFEIIDNSCDNLHDLSILSYTEWKECHGVVDLINFKGGYSSIFDEMTKEFPLGQFLKLRTAVEKIELFYPKSPDPNGNTVQLKLHTVQYSGDVEDNEFAHKVLSSSLDSSEVKRQESIFDHVIITSSIGFLKENLNNSFFAFDLPKVKVDVIQALGFGTIDKIFMYFDQPFWEESGRGFQTLWLNVEDEHCYLSQLNERNYSGTFPQWVYCIQGFDLVRGQPNMLMAWIGSYGAKLMENSTDGEIGQVLGEVLRHVIPESYRRTTISDPSRVYASRWHNHPFIRGAYSNRTTNYQKLPLDYDYNIDVLGQPIRIKDVCSSSSHVASIKQDEEDCPLVLFAGEATDREHYSTTDGAMRSGQREAMRLFSFYYE